VSIFFVLAILRYLRHVLFDMKFGDIEIPDNRRLFHANCLILAVMLKARHWRWKIRRNGIHWYVENDTRTIDFRPAGSYRSIFWFRGYMNVQNNI